MNSAGNTHAQINWAQGGVQLPGGEGIAREFPEKPRQPPPLRSGDCIGIVFPAGPVRDQKRFAAGRRILHQLGFTTRCRPELPATDGYLAGSDQERAAELMAMWRDPSIQAIMAARGGYGCLRLLPHLDFTIFRQQPKLLVGFSDITILHSALYQQSGLSSLHGPVVTSLADDDTDGIRQFGAMLTSAAPPPIHTGNLQVLRPGTAHGPLLGGNLASLCSLLGTPYVPDYTGAILLLEDVGESDYRLDRMITQLHLAGKLAEPAGIILGTFIDGGKPATVWNRILECTDNIPVWANFPVGHSSRNLTVPHGLPATMDSATATLSFHPPLFR